MTLLESVQRNMGLHSDTTSMLVAYQVYLTVVTAGISEDDPTVT